MTRKDEQAEKLNQLNKKYKEMDSIYHNVALKFGISDSVFWILYAISETNGAVTQSELCNDWSYSKQTINSSISNLVRNGFLRRSAEKDGRKKILLSLTGKGQEFVKKTIDCVKVAELEAYRDLSENEQRQFLDLTEKYLENFRKEIEKI